MKLFSKQALFLLRCPVCSLPTKRLRCTQTAATHSAPLTPPQAAVASFPKLSHIRECCAILQPMVIITEKRIQVKRRFAEPWNVHSSANATYFLCFQFIVNVLSYFRLRNSQNAGKFRANQALCVLHKTLIALVKFPSRRKLLLLMKIKHPNLP